MAADQSAASSATDDSTSRIEILKKVDDLIAQGKRHMVCGEIPKAVTVFEEAVKQIVKESGEMSHDCANAYFNCGVALLELGRMETNVLGVALDGVDVEEEKDEPSSEQFEKPPDDEGDGGTEEDEKGSDDSEPEGGDEIQEGEESQEEGKDDDVSHFQLAWEYLDIAKVIYLKSESKEDQLRGAECLTKLGELSMETDQHETAAADLLSALKIQEKQLDADNRLLAETHYQIGLAFGLNKEFELSIKHYTLAISVLEAKIASLSALIEEREVDAENKENRETDNLRKYKEEIKELQELIPEMKDKIEDTKTEQQDMEKMKQMAKEMLGLAGTTKGFGSPIKKTSEDSGASGSAEVDENGQKKATDISSLVRKKRKPEEEGSDGQEQKKPRQTLAINGTPDETDDTTQKTDEADAASTEPMAV